MYIRITLRAVVAALLTLGATLHLGGCTMISQTALDPIDWADKAVERYPATGRGVIAQLRSEPVGLGPYSAISEAKSPWSNLPVQTTSNMQVGLGGENGSQFSSGTNSVRNESEVKVRLIGPPGELASIQCREVLTIENREARLTNQRGENNMSMTENVSHEASLKCRSRSLGPTWPQWQMDLHATGQTPLQGVLSVDGQAFEVVGSQASSRGVMRETVSYEVRRGRDVLALIDRSSDGQLSIVSPKSERQRASLFGAAAVLLLAHDPLSQH